MGPVGADPLPRVTLTAGRLGVLCLIWPVLSVLCQETAQAQPLRLLSSLRATSGSEELHLLGLLPLEELLPSLKSISLQKAFMEALPAEWALPAFSTSSVRELSELQSWLGSLKKKPHVDNLRKHPDFVSANNAREKPLTLHELLEAVREVSGGVGSFSGEADRYNVLPTLLKDYTASLPLQGLPEATEILHSTAGLALDEVFKRKVQLLQRLPSLDQLDIHKLAHIFAIPSDIEWPVERARLALLLPVLTSAEDGGLLASSHSALVERSGVTAFKTESGKMLLPLTRPDGQLLFAKIQHIFPSMRLPQTLTLLPLATLRDTELVTVEALWAGLKSALLPRQALMSADSTPSLLGPVLNLTNLAKLTLASDEPLRTQFLAQLRPSSDTTESSNHKPATAADESDNRELLKAFSEALEAGFPIEEMLKNLFTDLSMTLQQAILPFEGIFALDGKLPSSRYEDLEQWKSDWEDVSPLNFRDNLFFRLQLPVVAITRESIPNTFRLLHRLPASPPCDGENRDGTCALGSMPTLLMDQETVEEGIAALYRRVEILTEQLKASVYQLQLKVAELIAANEADIPTVSMKPPTSAAGTSSRGGDPAAFERNPAASAIEDRSSSQNVKVPEGFYQGGRVLDLPSRFFIHGKHSNQKYSALQEALDASVKLCDTLSVALRFTKNEVRSLQHFNGHTGGIGLSRQYGGGPIRPVSLQFDEFNYEESPYYDNRGTAFTNSFQDSDVSRLPFLANIHGRSLAAFPRNRVRDLTQDSEPSVELAAREVHTSTPHQMEQLQDQKGTVPEAANHMEHRRRLEATKESGALAAKDLVLLDPLALGNLLFAHLDSDRLLEPLKRQLADATKAVPQVGNHVKDADESMPQISLLTLLKDLFTSNSLAFPALALPVADLLRIDLFPKVLLQVPVGEWIPHTWQLSADAAPYTMSELLQVQSLASQLKSLPLKDLIGAESSLTANMSPMKSDILRQSIGDLHLKSLIPPQLADLSLDQLLTLPAQQQLKLVRDVENLNSLSLGKLLALDEAAVSLFTQPFGDVLGLKGVLENLTFETTRQPPAPPQNDMSDSPTEQSVGRHPGGNSTNRIRKLLGRLIAPVESSEAAPVSFGGEDLLDLTKENRLTPGSLPEMMKRAPFGQTLSLNRSVTEGLFLPGKRETQDANLPSGPLTLAELIEGVRSQRPMIDPFRYLLNTAGVTLGNELLF